MLDDLRIDQYDGLSMRFADRRTGNSIPCGNSIARLLSAKRTDTELYVNAIPCPIVDLFCIKFNKRGLIRDARILSLMCLCISHFLFHRQACNIAKQSNRHTIMNE